MCFCAYILICFSTKPWSNWNSVMDWISQYSTCKIYSILCAEFEKKNYLDHLNPDFLCLSWPWSSYSFTESRTDSLIYGQIFTSRRTAGTTSPVWLPVLSNLTSVYCLGLTQLPISPRFSPLSKLFEMLEGCCVIFNQLS